MRFEELNISEPILKALTEVGYTTPTPIQEQAIPPVLEGRDVLGCAQTGTGKTAAFAVPILQRLGAPREKQLPKRPVRALILTPTRELALQIYENFIAYGKYTGHTSAVIFGGVSQVPQVDALKKGVDVLIATPGRLWDLMGQKQISLSGIECFVLDEADRMLDMGFFPDVKRIIRLLPSKRQTLLFSATMPSEIADLADSLLADPVHIAVTPAATPVEAIRQYVYMVDRCNKRALLAHVIREKGMQQTLVFTRTKHGADRVARELKRGGIQADAIHGDKSQGARQRALNDFKDGKIIVLVATDIAARGIDISGLPYVINFDLPEIPETYVHRIGRTGRAGMEGTAISFCDGAQMSYLIDIEELTGKRIEEVEDHAYPMTGEQPAEPEEKKSSGRGRQGGERRAQPQKKRGSAQPAGRSKPQPRTEPEQPAVAAADTAAQPQEASAPQPAAKRRRRRRRPAKPAEQGNPETRQAVSPKAEPVSGRPVKVEPKPAAVRTEKARPNRQKVEPQIAAPSAEQKPAANVNKKKANAGRGGRRPQDRGGAQVETKPLPAKPLTESLRARVAAKVAAVLAGRKKT
ncbi:MAG: DEAD/DEAH box helicase [Intestinibacillus sp.]